VFLQWTYLKFQPQKKGKAYIFRGGTSISWISYCCKLFLLLHQLPATSNQPPTVK
jgi:hypothetical protein